MHKFLLLSIGRACRPVPHVQKHVRNVCMFQLGSLPFCMVVHTCSARKKMWELCGFKSHINKNWGLLLVKKKSCFSPPLIWEGGCESCSIHDWVCFFFPSSPFSSPPLAPSLPRGHVVLLFITSITVYMKEKVLVIAIVIAALNKSQFFCLPANDCVKYLVIKPCTKTLTRSPPPLSSFSLCHSHPTNNALLTNFWLSSDAEIVLIRTNWACKLIPKMQKRCMRHVPTYSDGASILHATIGGWANNPSPSNQSQVHLKMGNGPDNTQKEGRIRREKTCCRLHQKWNCSEFL